MTSNYYPNYENLKNDMLSILERCKKGELQLKDIHWEASDLDDEYFPDEYPEWENENLYSLYTLVLFKLHTFSRLFPEDVPIIEETLNCKPENFEECFKKWKDYWSDKDYIKRRKEGIKRGYWKE